MKQITKWKMASKQFFTQNHAYNSITWKVLGEKLVIKASFGYIASSRTAWATWDSVFKNTNKMGLEICMAEWLKVHTADFHSPSSPIANSLVLPSPVTEFSSLSLIPGNCVEPMQDAAFLPHSIFLYQPPISRCTFYLGPLSTPIWKSGGEFLSFLSSIINPSVTSPAQ